MQGFFCTYINPIPLPVFSHTAPERQCKAHICDFNGLNQNAFIDIIKTELSCPVFSGGSMREESVQYFTENEEKIVSLLIGIGMNKNVAKVLVFLLNIPQATAREIERGVDIRQPEVSTATRYLTEQGWIALGKTPSERKGRPQKSYSLALPLKEIIARIEKTKKNETNNQLAMFKKMRGYFS
jgi:predicted transcriptional regulator